MNGQPILPALSQWQAEELGRSLAAAKEERIENESALEILIQQVSGHSCELGLTLMAMVMHSFPDSSDLPAPDQGGQNLICRSFQRGCRCSAGSARGQWEI